MDDPEPLPPKLVFLDHFFGENVLFHQFDPTNTPKCYTWLESYGSSLRDGKNKKNIFSSCEASDFRGRSQTDFLHDLEARHTLGPLCLWQCFIPKCVIFQLWRMRIFFCRKFDTLYHFHHFGDKFQNLPLRVNFTETFHSVVPDKRKLELLSIGIS